MYGSDILCGISKGTFEIPHKISYQYIEMCRFYPQQVISCANVDLRFFISILVLFHKICSKNCHLKYIFKDFMHLPGEMCQSCIYIYIQ